LLNNYTLSVLLGIVEGLTEFLPVSSTAHLRIAEKLCQDYHLANINLETPYWKMYTIVIQLGAILALPILFMPHILKLLGNFPRGEKGDRTIFTHPLSLTMLAFVVTAVPAKLLDKVISKNLDNFFVMGAALVIGGIIMWIVDYMYGEKKVAAAGIDAMHGTLVNQAMASAGTVELVEPVTRRTTKIEQVTIKQAIFVGIAQIFAAVFPGTSRSMSTIAGGQLAGMSRPAALEFSFFVSIPTMFAATVYALLKAIHPKDPGEAFSPKSMDKNDWIILAIGFGVSFIVSLGVVAAFMSWVRRRGFVPFAIYRILCGGWLLWWAWSAAH